MDDVRVPADRPTIALKGVGLRGDDDLFHGPLDLSLAPGEGALVTVENLGLMRRLMKCCLGFAAPASGRISWWMDVEMKDGAPDRSFFELYRRIGYVDRQSQILTSMTLLENLILFHEYARIPDAPARAGRLLDWFGLSADEGLKGYALPEPVRRRALYALAFCGGPRLMLMERPLQFLDRDFYPVWDLVLRQAAESGMVYIVFDRTRSIYSRDHFTHFVDF